MIGSLIICVCASHTRTEPVREEDKFKRIAASSRDM